MTSVDLNDFCKEIDCIYDGENYSVRDNGSVLRHLRPGKRQRPLDALWTLGKPDSQKGYMVIASVPIHRIVATAFHGNPPTPEYVVDHIDTNRRNNRPENLRWLTRLENVLKNPMTVKRIEFICGSIEAFLADPSKLHENDPSPNYKWMRTVNAQEAKACLERMNIWANNDKAPSGGSLDEWVFKPTIRKEPIPVEPRKWDMPPEFSFAYSTPKVIEEVSDLVMAMTPGAAQRNWRIPSEFPCCPQKHGQEPIADYAKQLEVGKIFAHNHILESVVVASAMSNDRQSLWVMCEMSGIKPWSLAQITFEDGLYVHTTLGTFFDKVGAEEKFCLAQGLEWAGGDSIDNYC